MSEIPTYTGFFRVANIAEFSHSLAPELAQQMGGILLAAEIGCSSGQESWSMAAALEANQVDYHIEAFDIDAEAIAQTQQPYAMPRLTSLANTLQESRYPDACLDYFETKVLDTDDRPLAVAEPKQTLRDKVSFEHRDLLDKPLPANNYGVVVINNVLYHHANGERDKLAGNAVDSLIPGGALLVESFYRRHSQDYLLWRNQLAGRFGLKAVNRHNHELPTIFQKLA